MWKLKVTEGYKLSKAIDMKVTQLLFKGDLKVFATSEGRLERVMTFTRDVMMCVGLQWNKKKCILVHVKRECLSQTSDGWSEDR